MNNLPLPLLPRSTETLRAVIEQFRPAPIVGEWINSADFDYLIWFSRLSPFVALSISVSELFSLYFSFFFFFFFVRISMVWRPVQRCSFVSAFVDKSVVSLEFDIFSWNWLSSLLNKLASTGRGFVLINCVGASSDWVIMAADLQQEQQQQQRQQQQLLKRLVAFQRGANNGEVGLNLNWIIAICQRGWPIWIGSKLRLEMIKPGSVK